MDTGKMIKVITYGTFDLLQRAKQLVDYLIVGVTSEEYDQARGKLNIMDSLMTNSMAMAGIMAAFLEPQGR